MYRFVTTHLRRYPLSCLCLVLIFVLSFVPFFPETPLDGVAFIDKWTHLVMYGGTTAVVWWEYVHSHSRISYRSLMLAVAGMILLGVLVELLQAYCTTTRSGEWLDFLADSVGVGLGSLVGYTLHS